MPDTSNDATNAAIIQSSGQLISTAGNAYAQGRMNKKTQEYNDRVYARSRADSLKDWAMQNEYNSPTAQMQRFRDANLNPNLIYGQTNEGASVRSSDTPAWNPRAPQIDLNPGPVISQFYDTRLKEAQTDNLRSAITVQNAEAILKAAQTAATIQSTSKTAQDIAQASKLNPIALEAARANIAKTMADTQMTLDNNERQKALTSSSLMEAMERIGKIRMDNSKTEDEKKAIQQQIKNLEKDGQLKQIDIDLRKKGINPSDPTWIRLISTWAEKLYGTMKDLPKKGTFLQPFGKF